jgi:hypothetical protein
MGAAQAAAAGGLGALAVPEQTLGLGEVVPRSGEYAPGLPGTNLSAAGLLPGREVLVQVGTVVIAAGDDVAEFAALGRGVSS